MLALGLAVLLAPLRPAQAHIVYGSSSIAQLTGLSERVLRVRIIDPQAPAPAGPSAGGDRVVRAEVLETWKGAHAPGELIFAAHGHGVARYEAGEEVVVFLNAIERSRELRSGALARSVRWLSTQESDHRYPLDDANRAAFRDAIAGYVRLAGLPEAERGEALSAHTRALLASRQPALARSALSDVVRAADAAWFRPDDVSDLVAIVRDAGRPVGFRIGLLSELERRSLVDAPALWVGLLAQGDASQHLAVARALHAHPSPPVWQALRALLGGPDRMLAAAAAVSLGVPGHDAAVPALAALLDDPQPRLRMAAIRGLGAIGTAKAREALARAAQAHADPATRRRAAAEVRLLSRATPD